MSSPGDAALILGMQGGIGAALARQWRSEQAYARVLGSARQPAVASDPDCLTLDYRDDDSINSFAERVRGALGDDRLRSICICTGALHGPSLQPERRLADLRTEALQELLQVNAIGPLRVLSELVKFLPRNECSRILVLSARVGSIADNRLGGWVSYRVSKAALNQGVKTIAVELQRTHPQCIVTLYHPGTVDTPLSTPFQKRVPDKQLFPSNHAARCLSKVLHAPERPRSHLFMDWANQEVAY